MPEEMNKLISDYFNLVFEKLEKIIEGGNYYADWIADQLFLIIYNDEFHSDALEVGCDVAYALATSIYEEVKSKINAKITYDIGMVAGDDGYLGLMGPKKKMKTTVLGDLPGIAKRFESEAKEHRYRHGNNDRPPTVVFGPNILREFQRKFPEEMKKVGVKNADVKDVSNALVFLWNSDGLTVLEKLKSLLS
jgi:hypothetical protein